MDTCMKSTESWYESIDLSDNIIRFSITTRYNVTIRHIVTFPFDFYIKKKNYLMGFS